MLKFSVGDEGAKKIRPHVQTKFILSDGVALDASELIPIDLGGRLITPSSTINEMGKQLLRAASEGDLEDIKSLLVKGAPFTADWLGTSPLHLAAQNNHLEVCETLIRAGISMDARTKVDRTPLHMAAYEGHLEIVETLIKNGADHNCKDLLGMTPLHWAAQNGHYHICAELLKHNAQVDVINKFNLSPVDIAQQIQRDDIVQLLSNSAAQNLVFQLQDAEEAAEEEEVDPSPLENVYMNTDKEMPDNPQVSSGESLSDSMKLLQEHGITMLQNDESNILNSVIESGHTVVLTDVGKEVLDSMKAEPAKPKVVTITPEEYLVLTGNNKNGVQVVPKTVKTIVMKKNKVTALPGVRRVKDKFYDDNLELVMKQLIEARKTIEEYKTKLQLKELEAERYKQQLKRLLEKR